jgi:hypothetical protein
MKNFCNESFVNCLYYFDTYFFFNDEKIINEIYDYFRKSGINVDIKKIGNILSSGDETLNIVVKFDKKENVSKRSQELQEELTNLELRSSLSDLVDKQTSLKNLFPIFLTELLAFLLLIKNKSSFIKNKAPKKAYYLLTALFLSLNILIYNQEYYSLKFLFYSFISVNFFLFFFIGKFSYDINFFNLRHRYKIICSLLIVDILASRYFVNISFFSLFIFYDLIEYLIKKKVYA